MLYRLAWATENIVEETINKLIIKERKSKKRDETILSGFYI
jgi:hypothetical protein